MKLILDVNKLERIAEHSYYNHNYYKLPFGIEMSDRTYDIIYELCDEFSNSYDYYLGEFNEVGKWVQKYWFFRGEEMVIDFDDMSYIGG